MQAVRARRDGEGSALAGGCGRIEGEFAGGDQFLGDVIAGGGGTGVSAGFHGGIHLAGEGGGNFDGPGEGLACGVSGDDFKRHRVARADQTIDP